MEKSCPVSGVVFCISRDVPLHTGQVSLNHVDIETSAFFIDSRWYKYQVRYVLIPSVSSKAISLSRYPDTIKCVVVHRCKLESVDDMFLCGPVCSPYCY